MNSKVVLITGASSGFGKEAIPLLLERGHRVIACLRGGEERAKSLFQQEFTKYSDRLCALDLHLEKHESFQDILGLINERYGGKLDVLVNNAGYGLLGPFTDQTEEQIRHQFEVNFFGPALLTQRLIPALFNAKGRILNISSIGGLMAFPYSGTYNATKHALEAHTEGLYYELKPLGVQVGLIEPGVFKTEFAGRSLILSEKSKTPTSLFYKSAHSFERWMTDNLRFGGDPKRVSRLIVRLCDVKNVPIRSVVGADAKFMFILRTLLPENFRVGLMEMIFRKFVLNQ